MPRKYELTWASRGDGSGRWQKFYKGKIYRFGGTHRSDVEDYKRALAEWVQLRAQLDSQVVPSPVQVEYSAAIKEWGDVITWAVVNGDEAIAARAREKLAELQDRAELPSPPPLGPTDRFGPLQPPTPRPIPTGPLGREPGPEPLQVVGPIEWATPERLDRVIWTDRLEVQNRKKTPPGEDVAGRVEDYLKIRRRDVDLGKLSAGRYDPIRVHLQAFRDWIGPATSVKAISAKVVQDFHGHLSTAIFEKKISGIYAKDRFNEFRTFVKWLWQSELIDALPRNLDASNLRISKGPVEVETMKIAEVNRLLAEARDRTKLYLLLMLNCGMTQVDVADLKQAEVDLARGTVTRKRSKTSHHEGVPTVTYRLWPETLRLLKQERAQTGELMLTNEDGGPLKTEELKDGKLRKIDNIKSAFSRLCVKLGVKHSLIELKKTSATEIKKKFPGLEPLFLGHAPATMSDKHYTTNSPDVLDEALAWLGKQYVLTPEEQPAEPKKNAPKS